MYSLYSMFVIYTAAKRPNVISEREWIDQRIEQKETENGHGYDLLP